MSRAGKRLVATVFVLLGVAALGASPADAAFGLLEGGFTSGFTAPDGSAETQAGSHPGAMSTGFKFNFREEAGQVFVEDAVKDVVVTTPLGFAGNPTATPRCSGADFAAIDNTRSLPACPNSTAVGTVAVDAAQRPGFQPSEFVVPLYNVEPGPGAVLKLGFVVINTPVTVEARLSESKPYRVIASGINVSQAITIFGVDVSLWGDPADPAHDPVRGNCVDPTNPNHAPGEPVSVGSCPVALPQKPLLTMPRACPASLDTQYAIDAWQNPGARLEDEEPVLSDPAWLAGSGASPGLQGCDQLEFKPSIASHPTADTAESPSGLDFGLDFDDPGLSEPDGIAGSDIEKAVVTLPEGFTTNSSVASGLAACTLAQYDEERLDSAGGCPQASTVGSVEVETPLLEEEGTEGVLRVLRGSIYVAKQGDNPFGNLLTIYMVIRDPKLGILIKLAGKVDPDPVTGRLTTTFADLPQFPFSHFNLHFHAGPRAPLMTPATCGQFTTEAMLYPYANPTAPVQRTASFSIEAGAGGGSCASTPAQLPHAPSFSAGTLTPTAGAYSPFVLRLSRSDGSQQFSSITTTLPQGLVGKLAGIPYCSDEQIAQAQARSAEGQGAAELASPSCPLASEVGTVTVGAGAGPEPFYVNGHAYLAGPYKGAPLSLVIITPAIAGPFDLGVVAVRTALDVNPETAQITAVSDPIPTILHGLPLDVRSIAIDMARPQFTLNPTSCEPTGIVGSALSTLGGVAPLFDRFQVGGCEGLGFKPGLKIQLKGATGRIGHPALKATVTYPNGGAYANIARAQVNLPHAEFLDQGNLNKTCTKPVLLAGNCPTTSIYGKVKAWTPLLDRPLEGNVYLVGGYGYKLPALVADLNGQIRILLVGKVDSGKNKGIRNTFEVVPDAPVSRFVLEMKGGKKYGLLENSENLCHKTQRASARFVAQNGVAVQLRPKIANSCGKKKHGNKHTHRRAKS